MPVSDDNKDDRAGKETKEPEGAAAALALVALSLGEEDRRWALRKLYRLGLIERLPALGRFLKILFWCLLILSTIFAVRAGIAEKDRGPLVEAAKTVGKML